MRQFFNISIFVTNCKLNGPNIHGPRICRFGQFAVPITGGSLAVRERETVLQHRVPTIQ